jgi:N-methylhydantoinase A/oxoprolinase/acetone carboxylase beta subunit
VYSVDIDVGGTLTDGIFRDSTRLVCAKVDSTPHDLTVCLFDCLTQGATHLGFADLAGFLEQVELLRWSTTLTSNVLAELRGPKIGLIVSKGHEQDLYGKQRSSPAVNRIVDQKNVLGIAGSDGSEILAAVRSLLGSGVRRICISLQGALQNSEEERRIKRAIDEQYPDHYLGSVPVLIGSDICQNTDDMTRTHSALINAYTHSALAATLFKAEDELRYSLGYSRPFLISHINGGVAGVSKTRAIDTLESGPTLGIYGASYLAKAYGLKNVIALDVGGTTAKIGVIWDGEAVYSRESDWFGVPVRLSLPYLRSVALGGGSVVRATDNGVTLGPESMGSFPGPVCYALGGEKPTLTDAFVTAGLIDPDRFLGGAKRLDLELARGAIDLSIARVRRLSIQEACRAIIERAFDMVAEMISNAGCELQQDFSGHALFAYGGNGGLFACGVATRAGLRDAYLLALGPVFSAFGSSVSDIAHVYERSFHLPLEDGADLSSLNRVIEEMSAGGVRDLLGEGIKPEGAEYSLEMELSQAAGPNVNMKCPRRYFSGADELRRALGLDQRKVSLELVRLRVMKTILKPTLPPQALQQEHSGEALLGARAVAYGSSTGQAKVYKWESLRPGNKVEGCAILEAENTTYLVPEGWSLQVDQYGNAQARRAAEGSLPSQAATQEARSHGKR